ncbi:hypothetical protein [Acidocella facilis]|nr:hypothetical protein [Acidocella facilis]
MPAARLTFGVKISATRKAVEGGGAETGLGLHRKWAIAYSCVIFCFSVKNLS